LALRLFHDPHSKVRKKPKQTTKNAVMIMFLKLLQVLKLNKNILKLL